jgi:membrane protein implicated in regulation of membrane protease activity
MMPFNGLGKLLILLGSLLIIIGAAIVLVGKIPWVGKLPGDIYVERRNFTFFFPLTTSILVSIILSLVLYLLSRR